MIDVKVNVDDITIRTVDGTGLRIMTELCVLVDSVCTVWAADEKEEASEFRRLMMEQIAEALKKGATKECCKK